MARTSRSSQGSEGSISQPKPLDSDASVKSNGTQAAPVSSSGTGPTLSDGVTLLPTPTAGDAKSSGSRNLPGSGAHSGTSLTDLVRADRIALLPTPHAQEAGWTPDGDQDPAHRPYQEGQHRTWGIPQIVSLLLSSEDSLANLSVPLEDERPRMTTAGSGLSSSVSRASLDHDGSWLKTYPDSSVQASLLGQPLEKFSEAWPRSGTMRDGTVYEHPTSVQRTNGNASSSLLPTATQRDYKGARTQPRHPGDLLPDTVGDLLHTPTTGDGTPRYDHRASPGYVRKKPVPNLDAQIEALLGDSTNPPSEDGSE